ncbi:MAG: manganese efflux pump MntP family protein [Lachnospiraceae bacterium]|nr:manganese efflux pump MntP family protein [Lachnospiraceae bacterium]MDD7664712.1 manganese efflux pump MntP family protein [Lachnospiraceae bacterium]MDY4165419.1 manganese efflux pump MntP family protein [Lachnospiraceae bacterium]
MNLVEIFLLGVGLSMDALAVAVCKGLAMRKVNKKQCLAIALAFGGFQSLMPIIGWALGSTFARYIRSIDHWIAFFLLLYIGGKMVIEAVREWNATETVDNYDPPLDIKELLMMAVATSIDALAVGVTFSFTPHFNILGASSLIGVTTFGISYVGVYLGNIFGSKFEKKAELVGGLILIAIGTRILITHLMGLE